jgi:antitoxin component HigA of HigAB toxin-antitoxin module
VTASYHDGRMQPQSPDRTGILIVRLWIEANVHGGFRARITQTLDSASPDQTKDIAATPDDIYAVVRTWVEAFVRSEAADKIGPEPPVSPLVTRR